MNVIKFVGTDKEWKILISDDNIISGVLKCDNKKYHISRDPHKYSYIIGEYHKTIPSIEYISISNIRNLIRGMGYNTYVWQRFIDLDGMLCTTLIDGCIKFDISAFGNRRSNTIELAMWKYHKKIYKDKSLMKHVRVNVNTVEELIYCGSIDLKVKNYIDLFHKREFVSTLIELGYRPRHPLDIDIEYWDILDLSNFTYNGTDIKVLDKIFKYLDKERYIIDNPDMKHWLIPKIGGLDKLNHLILHEYLSNLRGRLIVSRSTIQLYI